MKVTSLNHFNSESSSSQLLTSNPTPPFADRFVVNKFITSFSFITLTTSTIRAKSYMHLKLDLGTSYRD